MWRTLLAGWLGAMPVAGLAGELPRVVSMNLCTDQLVLLLADPEQIVSLSRLSDDPRSSSLAQQARSYPRNSGRAEEIFLSAPDVLVAGRYSERATLDMLRAMGVVVEQFAITTSLAEIPEQIRTMGGLLQQTGRAEALASGVEARLQAASRAGPDAPVAAFYYPNGYSLGADTLSHDIVTTGGFRNLTQELGMTGGGRLDLEQLVQQAPDVLISSPRYGGHSRSEDTAFHPVLSHYAQDNRVIFSTSDWVCGTPLTLRAVQDVADARAALTSRKNP
ncbi:ABC transporter substrate-binding protein [Puniceibacterium confluentis]|uniref:ABC transporter substrate-binding protein n=2 Tax=Puniceibacterium confluentis TaxID=1958944 RepID=UPI001FE61E79|nr:ABC transporter substrate-binding protein [Puniceibacterium confluentis]